MTATGRRGAGFGFSTGSGGTAGMVDSELIGRRSDIGMTGTAADATALVAGGVTNWLGVGWDVCRG